MGAFLFETDSLLTSKIK